MKAIVSVPSLALLAACWMAAARAEVWRAPDYDAALKLAAGHDADIAVFQHGSDWSRLGQHLLAEVWETEALETALAAERLVLVAVDIPDTPGAPAVAGHATATAQPDDRPTVAADPGLVAEAQARIEKNKAFTWRGQTVPRIALMDRQGRPVASEDKPRLGLTPADLAARIRGQIAVRKERDAVWTAAESQQGAARAASLVRGLVLVGRGSPAKKNEPYRSVYDQIVATNDAAALRWLQFHPDQRMVPTMVQAAGTLAQAKEFAKAVALLDAELAHPANGLLTADHRQRILVGKFNILRQWPGHEEQSWDVLRQIVDLDPASFLGLGATGQLAMNHREDAPSAIVYGWAPPQVKPGVNTWNFHRDARQYFDLPGSYSVELFHGGGKDSLRILVVRLLAGETLLCEAKPEADLAPSGRVACRLTRPDTLPEGPLVLQVVAEAAEGKTDLRGTFVIEPQL